MEVFAFQWLIRHMTNTEMTILSFDEASCFSTRDSDYASKTNNFKEFFHFPPTLNGLKLALTEREKHSVDRELLCSVLMEQYKGFTDTEKQIEAIESLKRNDTYTIVTAHQPCLFLGPLYTIYKSISAIKLAKQLSEETGKTIVPVFVVGGEDHDFDEINHTYLFNQKLSWENDSIGPVGRMSADTLSPSFNLLQDIIGNHPLKEDILVLLKDYSSAQSFSKSTRSLLHNIFKDQGLLVLSMDDSRLKRAFIPEMQKELIQRPSKKLVEAAQNVLEGHGYNPQAFPREINLFYINDLGRNRIVFEQGAYQILNTDIKLSETELIKELHSHPEKFSPNVVMRPIYQEKILPNLAYVGGGGELAYWLERKNQFAEFECFFPALIRRDSFMIIDHKTIEKINDLNLTSREFFEDENKLIQDFIDSVKPEAFELTEERQNLEIFYRNLINRIESLDKSLAKSAAGEEAKALKGIEHLETKLNRLYKDKQSTSINRIQKIKNEMFPNGKLQERHDNFIQYFLKYGKEWFDVLLDKADPLDARLKILVLSS